MTFEEMTLAIWKSRKKGKTVEDIPSLLVALDPGETTGYAVFRKFELIESGQIKTNNMDTVFDVMNEFIASLLERHYKTGPAYLVFEDYKVYGWKTKDHAWASLHTPQLLGTIRAVCSIHGIPYTKRMAQLVKQFCTDAKLKEWDFYVKGEQHARDAIRHAAYEILFNDPRKTKK